MADNTELSAGSGGDTIGSDDIGGVKYQRVKLIIGADGSNDGDVASGNPLPVTGTVTANLGATDNGVLDAIAASVATLDDIVSGSEAQVDVVSSALPTGAATAAKQPALGTAGTASSDVISVQGIASMTPIQVADNGGALTVDNGGTFAVQAAQSGTWNVTNVSGTVSLPTGASTAAKQPALGTAGSASTDVITVQGIASMTALVVDGSGVTQPVSGTVTADLGATDNAVLDAIAASVGTIDNAISGSEMQVDVVAALPAGTNNIGDVDVLSIVPGTGATNLGKAEDAAHSSGDVGVMALGVRAASPTERSAGPTDGDYVPLGVNAQGAQWVTPTPSTVGGLTIFRSLDLDETEEDIKTSAGQVFGWYLFNAAATTRYVKFYNATAANVTVGSTTPVLTVPVPAGSAANAFSDHGIAFATAISAAATTGVADADTGAPSANDVVINVFYK